MRPFMLRRARYTSHEGRSLTVLPLGLTGWLMSIIMSAVIRKYVRSGKVEVTPWDWSKHPILRFLPRARGRRNLLLGFAAAVIFSPPLMALVYLLGIDPWSFTMVFIAKVIYGMFLGVAVGPFIATAAIVGDGAIATR